LHNSELVASLCRKLNNHLSMYSASSNPSTQVQQEKEAQIEKEKVRKINVVKSETEKTEFKLAPKDYSYKDYFTVSDIFREVASKGLMGELTALNELSIFISPNALQLMSKKLYGIAYDGRTELFQRINYNKSSRRTDDKELETERNDVRLSQIADTYNFYYIKNNDSNRYLIISDSEFYSIYNFLKKYSPDVNIVIKNKLGCSVYPEIDHNSNPESGKELFVRMVSGKYIGQFKYLKMFQEIKPQTVKRIQDNFCLPMFRVLTYEKEFVKHFKDAGAISDFGQYLDKLSNSDPEIFFRLFSIDYSDLTESESDHMKGKLMELAIGSIQSGGYSEDVYYQKYLDVKKKYLTYKNKILKL